MLEAYYNILQYRIKSLKTWALSHGSRLNVFAPAAFLSMWAALPDLAREVKVLVVAILPVGAPLAYRCASCDCLLLRLLGRGFA